MTDIELAIGYDDGPIEGYLTYEDISIGKLLYIKNI